MTGLQKTFAEGLKTRPNDLSVDWKVAAIKGKYLQDSYHDIFYAKARNLAWKLRRKIDEALTQVDVLIMPATPKKARPLPSENVSLKGIVLKLPNEVALQTEILGTGHDFWVQSLLT